MALTTKLGSSGELRAANVYPDLIKRLGFAKNGELARQMAAHSARAGAFRGSGSVTSGSLALLVGFGAEARVARLSGWRVAIGGGTSEGAALAARGLIEAGATGIVSFGLAGGLDPKLPAGTLVVARAVAADGQVWPTDPGLSARLGGGTGHLCLGLDHVVVSIAEKRRLSRETGAAVVDMESGAVAAIAAAAGVPFAVLRAVCDPADRALPPAALVALDGAGRMGAARMAMSVMASPGQLGALCGLARDAATARRALRARALRLAPDMDPHHGDTRHGMHHGIRPHGILPASSLQAAMLAEDLVPGGLL
jgi:adenosylhomocysteine nucleosidase